MDQQYYLTYNSGAGIFGYTGGETLFDANKPAIVFANKTDAREAMKSVRRQYSFTGRGWRRFYIVELSEAYIRNR